MTKVFLVGAGPGDPDLLTLKAVRALSTADVVLVDELVSRGCLAHARPGAKIVAVGKRGGCRSTPQGFIDRLLVRYARQGKKVVRLKGGDPFVFGRGGEEVQALLRHGIEVEIVPGITAGTAVPAALGIPLTHRGLARGVTFLTGHDSAGPDWEALVQSGTTLVIYMGLKNLQRIIASLRDAGMNPATPACLIENGTLEGQKQVLARLDTLSAAGFTGPALIIVGDVVRLARGAAVAIDAQAA